MAAQKRHSFLTLFLIFVLCLNLLNVQIVRADGETPTEPPAPTQVETEPPAATEEPTEPPTEGPTEIPTEGPTEIPTEGPTEIPTEIPVEETPTPVPVIPTTEEPTQVPVETEETPTPIAEILTQLPESTQVVVVDEEGTPVPLASEEAAEIVIGFDPMWCPAGVLPGGPGCTTNFSSITALINNMISNTSAYAQNGVIYFVETTGLQTTGASFSLTNGSLGGTDFNTLSSFNLTLQGGWNGQNGASATFLGTTNFGNNSVSVGGSGNLWSGNVTLNNFSFSNGTQSQVNVYTSGGNISLSNVNVSNHGGGTNTATLSSTSGNITVDNASFAGNGTDSNGFSATTGTGSIAITNTSFTNAVRNGGNTYNGATLSASTVTLTNVTATGNDGHGVQVNNANLVTLNNVTASNNGTESGPGGLNGNTGSGVFVNGTVGSSVIINGGTFNNNQEYGVEVRTPANTTIYIQATPTCTGNDSNNAGQGCYNDTTIFDSTGPVITPTVTGTSGANGWYTSNVSVSWAVSDPESGVRTQNGCTTSNQTSETSGVTFTCSATNNARLSNSVSVTIKIDKSAPTASLSIINGTQGSNGWYTSDVTVQTAGGDAISGVSCTANQVLSTETAGMQVNGLCTNGAGLVTNASPLTIKLDKTAPVVILSVTAGNAGSNGWYTSNVTVHTGGTESVSGPVTCTADQFQTAETGGTNFNGSCTNNAGLTGNASALTIKLDKTNPSISFTGRTAPNSTGWNNTNVTANWACSDPLSGPASDIVNQTLTSEGAGQSVTGTCIDLAGNTASDTQGGINIDRTAPTLSLPSSVTEEATSSAGATVAYTATVTDNLDTNVTVSCDPASGSNFPIGSTKVDCSSSDQADNTANGSFLVQVGDTSGPVIAAHADVTAEATSASGATVSYTSPTATDAVDGPVAVTCAPASGGNFSLGNTTITCNASDSQGNNATPTTFVIQVVDTTGPVIGSHADVTVEATSATDTVVTYANPSATDLVDGSVSVTCSPASGAAFPLGDNIVTCNASDSHGNNAKPTTFTVHVVDTTVPVIDFAGDIIAEATSPAGAAVTYANPPATDLVDGSVPVTCAPASGETFPLGDTTVTCNATDSSGNQAVATTFAVHVVDTTAPVIAAHADVTVQATSAAGAIANYKNPSTSDAVDGAGTATCSPASGEQFPLGDTTVTCTAVDSRDNEAAPTTFVVHVVDTGGPVIEAHADVTAEASSASGAAVNYTSPTATDVVDGPVPVSCSPASGATFPLGITTVTCTAEDSQGNAAAPTTFVVNVIDTTPPSIADHADVTAEAETNAGVFVSYGLPSAYDLVDGPVTVTCAPASNTLFALGDTTVTCEATDQHENTATNTFVIHVVDTTAPVIAGASDITVEATGPSGASVTYNEPTATDAVDGTVSVNCSPASGTTFALGNTTVTCNAMDSHNNLAKPVTFIVHVLDTTAPTLNLPGSMNISATGPSGAVVTFSVTASDTVDQNVNVTCDHQSGDTFPLGGTLVNCTATDDSGNQTQGSFFINVYDPEGPILSLPGNLTVEATSASGATVTFSVTATDLIDGDLPVECAPASGSIFGFGPTTVTCIAWDSSEHSNEGSFLVSVQDTTAPALAPQADITIETDSATGTVVSFTNPSTTDAVDGAGTASCTPGSGFIFPIGDTTVTCTAADAHGNTSTSSFIVHVKLSTPASTGATRTPGKGNTSSAIIPLTGGELIDLDCNSVLWAFGIKISFYNLCDYQTTLHRVETSGLPAQLPEGFSFVMGLDVDILSAGQFIEDLPDASGIEMDFPTYDQPSDQFAVLFWSAADGKWIEVSQQIPADQISQTLNVTAEDELYQILNENFSNLFHQALTTQKTGIFVLVKK